MASQKELRVVIDEWADAITALAEHAPEHARQAVHTATGDLLEAFGTSATHMATNTLKMVLSRLHALSETTTALARDTTAKNARIAAVERKIARGALTDDKLQAQIDTLAERIDSTDLNSVHVGDIHDT